MKELFLFATLLTAGDVKQAANMNNLGAQHYYAGHYREAEPLYLRALELWTSDRGKATTYSNLGSLYRAQGRYSEAEIQYLHAIELLKEDDSARARNSLAELYRVEGKLPEALTQVQLALSITIRVQGTNSLDFAQCLHTDSAIARDQGDLAKAQAGYERVRTILEQHGRDGDEQLSTVLSNMAEIQNSQHHSVEAERLARQALELSERIHGLDHPLLAASINNLAQAIRLQGRYGEAEPLYRRALTIWERTVGREHPYYALGLCNLAEMFHELGNESAATKLYTQALKTLEKTLGREHPQTVAATRELGTVLLAQGRLTEHKRLR